MLPKVLFLVFPAVILLHLYLSPYTKVEESLNIQAIHDLLHYGLPATEENYDHFTFPGPVPRTFTGALVISYLAKPFTEWLDPKGPDGALKEQMLARGILGLLNAAALAYYSFRVRRAFGRSTAVWFTLLQGSQFHVFYYASRTLPNSYAFFLTTIAAGLLLPDPAHLTSAEDSKRHYKISISLFTFAGIIFRSEVAILLGFTSLNLHLRRQLSLVRDVLPVGYVSAVFALTTTVFIDTYFWRTETPLWPELNAFWYNIVQGKAAEWGASPWYYYFMVTLPKLLLNPLTILICLPTAWLTQGGARSMAGDILLPNLSFIAIYSLVSHKEWRFIIYTIPSITTVAAMGANWVWTRRNKTCIFQALSLCLAMSTAATFIISNLVFLPVSMANYPGGSILGKLQEKHGQDMTTAKAYLDDYACKTGVTKFLSIPVVQHENSSTTWEYVKGPKPVSWDGFDFALLETNAENSHGPGEGWVLKESDWAFDSVRVVRPGDPDDSQDDLLDAVLGKLMCWRCLKLTARTRITKGWWVELRTAPKIGIWEKQRPS